MSEEAEVGEGEEPKQGLPKIVLILFGTNTLLVVGLAVMVLMGGNDPATAAVPEGGAAEEAEAEPAQPSAEVGPMKRIGGLMVNLANPTGDRFLRMSVDVELSNDAAVEELQAHESRVRDRIISYVSTLRFTHTQGAAGKDRIRKTLLTELNSELRAGTARGVYFTEFVAQ